MKVTNSLALCMAVWLLSACSAAPQPPVAHHDDKHHVVNLRGTAMTDTCVEQAAQRYNVLPQRIQVLGVDAFQGSYEMRGYTPRQEAFTCSFDNNGAFMHLSMR